MLLENKVVVVSGIGPGMGRDISIRCAEAGADIVLAARTKERLDEVAKEIEALGRKALTVRTDISDASQRENLAKTAIAEMGKVDVLVNNAFQQPPFTMLEDISEEEWNQSLNMNCTAALALTQQFVPHFKEHKETGGSSVVMINSMSIRRVLPNFGAYAAAKAALFSITRSLAVELGEHKIRVNGVAPGYIWGDSVEWYFEHLGQERGVTGAVIKEEHEQEIALRHIPDSYEISGAVLFFASDLSCVITGQTLDVNGGHYFHF